MNLKHRIETEFIRLASTGLSPAMPGLLQVDDTDGRLECELLEVDALACAFNRLTFQSDKLAAATLDQLKRLSESLSQRLSYLLEPIRPIETDADSCTVQLRSSPPSKTEQETSYYELVVRRGGELTLSRYSQSKTSGQPRDLVPAHVTKEVFCRLAKDFSGALGTFG